MDSTIQTIARTLLGVVIAGAGFAILLTLLHFYVKNFFTALLETPTMWAAVWAAMFGVSTLLTAVVEPSFGRAAVLGLVVATGVAIIWLALIAVFDSQQDPPTPPT